MLDCTEKVPTYSRGASGSVNQSFVNTLTNPSHITGYGTMLVSFIQRKPIRAFDGAACSDPSKFNKNYERLTSSRSEQTKVDTFCQYLEGAASDWLELLELDLKQEITVNEISGQCNKWNDLTWKNLKTHFEREVIGEKLNELVGCRQGYNEQGLTFFM